MNINEIIKIHKQNNLGFSSRLPKFILKFWYIYQIYITRSCVLITENIPISEKYNIVNGFILFDLNRNEIVIMAVDKDLQNIGIGTNLLLKLPKDKDIIVTHRKNHEQSRKFYEKNGFKHYIDLDNNLIISIRKL